MKKNLNLILIVLSLVVITGCTTKNDQAGQINQTSEEKDGYLVYNNIPKGIKYAKPGQKLDDKLKKDFENVSDFMFKDPSIDYGDRGDYSTYICKATKEKPVFVKLFKTVAGCKSKNSETVEGCGGTLRSAVICDKHYLIEVLNMSFGPKIYGPFKLSWPI